MPRTIRLVAIVLAAIAAFAAATAQPAPPPPTVVSTVPPAPPPPVPPQAAVTPAAIPGTNPDVPPTEVYQNVTFSIADAAPVEAGKPLVFRVTREGFDGRAHEVRFQYSGEGMLIDPPQSMRFEPGDPSQRDLEVQTAPDQPGDGPNSVQVLMLPGDESASIVARSASGTITQAAPSPIAVAYSVVPNGAFNRGHDLPFIVTRTGPLGPAQIAYRVSHDDPTAMIDDSVSYVEFAEGQPSAPLVVPADRVGQCATTVTVTLEDGAATSASASFAEPPPESCVPPPPPEIDYLPLILGCIAFVSALILDKILKPFVTVHPSCTIAPGTPAFRPLEQPVSRWPEIRADAAIEPGELHVTQPLPRSEPADG